jgi:hypothetical protein
MGWPTTHELLEQDPGGTEKDLRAVLPSPADAVDGVRVLCALLFEDGVTLLLRLESGFDLFEERPFDFDLFDDVGTAYSRGSGGAGGKEAKVSYRTPVPADATWLEMRRSGSRPIRIPL